MIVGLLILWLYFANRVRKEYLRTFQLKLREVAPKNKEKKLDLSNVSVLEGLRKVLLTGEETQIIFLLRKLRETPDERLFHQIKGLLDHPSDEVKAEALQNLYYLKSENLSEIVKGFINSPLQKVKIAAFEYLLLHEPSDEIALMKKYISDGDHKVSGAALVSLAKETRQNPNIQRQLDLEQMIGKKIKEIAENQDPDLVRFHKISVLKAVGHGNILNYYHIIKQYFLDADKQVVNEAIAAAGNTLSTLFVHDLLTFLSEESTRDAAEGALINYQDGIIDILKYELDQKDTDQDIIRNIPAIVKHINQQRSANLLFSLLDHPDGTVRIEALRGLNFLRKEAPHLDFHPKSIAIRILDEAKLYQNTLTAMQGQIQMESQTETAVNPEITAARRKLISLLDKKLNRNLERIFRLLGLKYPVDDMLQIYRGLNSKDSDLSVNAIEFLDNLLEPSIKKVLIPLIETSMLETISEEAIKNLKLKIPTESECFQMLLEGKDKQIKIATIILISRLENKSYLPLLEPLSSTNDEQIQSHTKHAIKELTAH